MLNSLLKILNIIKFLLSNTHICIITYQSVPKLAYTLGVKIVNENEYTFLIVNPEKSIMWKTVFFIPSVKSSRTTILVVQRFENRQKLILGIE